MAMLSRFFSMGVLAQSEMRPPRSLLAWMLDSLGPLYVVILPAVGLAVFVGSCLVVAMNRRPAVIAAFLVFLPLPLMVGFFASVEGSIASLSIIAQGGGTPQAAPLADGASTALFTTFLGLLETFPSYFVLAIGLFVRTLQAARLNDRQDFGGDLPASK